MAKASKSTKSLPEDVLSVLEHLGENLKIARERRGESFRSWAARMEVSVPTLQRMEKGDPAVGMGIYATAVWLAGQLETLSDVALPSSDEQALEMAIIKAKRRRNQ
jgi:transcriptional regulator with XRE-family HTH domain